MRPRHAAALAIVSLVLLLLPPAAQAAQTQGDWEFHFFFAKSSLDNQDPLALDENTRADPDGDGTFTSFALQRSLNFNDDRYAGFRLGYIWKPFFETEVSYYRNHTGSDFEQSFQDLSDSSGDQHVEGSVGTIFTSYQVGGLFFPLAFWRTPWQPYVALTAGWMDVDFIPSASLEQCGGANLRRYSARISSR
jgi:hypothetical protein